MRILAALGALVIVAVLGSIQFVASVTLRDRAEPAAWVAHVPLAWSFDTGCAGAAWPLPRPLLLVLAGHAVRRKDDACAEAIVARIPASPDRLQLEGRLAASHGQAIAALDDYIAANDLDDVETGVDAMARELRYADALRVQRALIAHLRTDPTQHDILARAYFELGHLEEAQAYRFYDPSKARAVHEKLAADAYVRALALSPNDVGYLIAYGNQLVNLEDFTGAKAAFLRAAAIDPHDSTPLAGLGENAFAQGDLAAANAALSRARALNPNDPAVVRLARELGS